MLPFLEAALGNAAVIVTPGSVTFSTPGTYQFTVPAFNSLTVDESAGGGGADVYVDGEASAGAGGDSSFNGNLIAYGGTGAYTYAVVVNHDEDGNPIYGYYMGNGGPGGGTGPTGATVYSGGGAAGGYAPGYSGSAGGAGGRAVRAYTPGELTIGALITVVVGAAGSNLNPYSVSMVGASGGSVTISWN